MKYNVGDTVIVHMDEHTGYIVEIIHIMDDDTYKVRESLPTGNIYGELYDSDENHHIFIE